MPYTDVKSDLREKIGWIADAEQIGKRGFPMISACGLAHEGV
ncbi:MAG: hypothetical protein V7641_2465 [Blastocatellia bacterium]